MRFRLSWKFSSMTTVTVLMIFIASKSVAQNSRNRPGLNEDRSEEWSQQGVASYKNGNYSTALEMFQKVDLGRYHEIRINIARTYVKLNKEEDAIKQIDMYLDSASATKRSQVSDFRKEANHIKSALSLSWAKKLAESNPQRAIELARFTASYQDDDYGADEAELSSQRTQAWTLILKIACKHFPKRTVLISSALENLQGLMDGNLLKNTIEETACRLSADLLYSNVTKAIIENGSQDLPEKITNDVIKGYVYRKFFQSFRDCRKSQAIKSTTIRFSVIILPGGRIERTSHTPWEYQFDSIRNDAFFYEKCIHDLIDSISTNIRFPLSRAESRAIISMDPWINLFFKGKKG